MEQLKAWGFNLGSQESIVAFSRLYMTFRIIITNYFYLTITQIQKSSLQRKERVRGEKIANYTPSILISYITTHKAQ